MLVEGTECSVGVEGCGVGVRWRARVVIRAYEQVVLCACAACCWCATMRLVSWMKLSRFADEKLFGCG